MRDHRPVHRAGLAALLLVVLQLAAGCSTGSTDTAPAAPSVSPTGYVVVSEAALRPGEALPTPTGEVVLTVDGGGLDRPVEFDTETLEKLGLVEYAADDKQALGRTATFRGVLLSSVLDAVGAGPATLLRATAVNDYTVDIPVADASTYPVLIATSVDGERMSVEKYGPLRIVYPTEDVTLDPTVYDPRWIWQLTGITLQ